MIMDPIKTINLLDLNKTLAKSLFEECEYAYEVLPMIKDYILTLGSTLSLNDYDLINNDVWLAKTAKIASNTAIIGPAIIGGNTEVRPGAFIRGNVIIGENCVIGNSTEVKNAILFDEVQVPHFNYIGDSVLGYKAHFGAGSITSNVKSIKGKVTLKIKDKIIETGLNKLGAIIGDFVEVGCNVVLNPGTIIGRNSNIYPLTSVKGYIEANTILKLVQVQQCVDKI